MIFLSFVLVQITLPTGTVVKMKHQYGIRVDITGSIRDFQHARGLCGNFDGNKDNEYKHRGSNPRPDIIGCYASTYPFNVQWSQTQLSSYLRSWRSVTLNEN